MLHVVHGPVAALRDSVFGLSSDPSTRALAEEPPDTPEAWCERSPPLRASSVRPDRVTAGEAYQA